MACSSETDDTESDRQIGLHSLRNADLCLEKGTYGRAFAHYLMVLKLLPSRKPEIKDSFTLALREWGEQLERQGHIEDLFRCYEQACDLFPECETMLNNMGAQLFRLGYIDEAACFFRRSLKLDPDYLGARENLENVCGHLVERWHFRMLNDRVRNEAYRGAIATAVRSGYDTVLDIGTGTGLLSLFAAEAGAKSVHGCDMSKTMYEMSCDIVYTNQMSDQVNLIHSKSTDLKIPEDLPEKVSLLVTEVFDAGLLGEGVIPTLYHAWKNLMQPAPLAKVIPKGGTMFICAIESEYIRSQNRFLYPGVQFLDFQGVNLVCKTSHSHISDNFEPYTSEWLDQIPGGCKLLTLPVPFAELDFEDPQSMEKYLVGFSQEFSLTVSVNGRLDAIATWFDLHLDCDHYVTSAPGSGSCWEQGVYPVLPSQLNSGQIDNLLVRETDAVTVKCFYSADCLRFKCTKITRSSCCQSPSKNPSNNLQSLSLSALRQNKPQSFMHTSRHANVLVEPIEQTCTYLNGNFGELDFGCGDINRLRHLSDDSMDRMRHLSNDSVGRDSHTENQCLEIIASVMNGESPPRNSHHRESPTPLSLNGNSPVTCSYLNGNLETTSPLRSDSGLARDLPSTLYLTSNNNHQHTPELEDIDVNLASASIQNLSMETKSSSDFSLDNADSNAQNEGNTQTFYLTREDIWKLNDLHYNRSICSALQEIRANLTEPNLKILALTDGVPVFALQALKLGASDVCLLDSQSHQPVLREIASVNDIPYSKLQFSQMEEIERLEGEWTVMLVELVDEGGCLQQRCLEDIALTRAACLMPEAIVMPGRVTVQALLIESYSLRTNSLLTSDNNTLGYLIAGFMNDFQMTTYAGINLSVLEHKTLSQPFELLSFDLNEFDLGQVPSYLDQSITNKVTAVETGTVHAVLYWFDLELTPKVKVSTLDNKFHWKQAAILQKTPITVSTGSKVKVQGMCRNSCIHAELTLL